MLTFYLAAPLGTVMNAAHPAAVNGRTTACRRATAIARRSAKPNQVE
jgi:hypothetical protein